MDLSQGMIRHFESKYANEEEKHKEEAERLESLPTAFEEGTWLHEDLEWIIEWKVGNAFVKPVLKHLNKNSNEEIRTKVNTAVRESSVRAKVEALTSLDGVGVPVASAILLFIDPGQFTVIDKRVWNVLRESEYLPYDLSNDPSTEDYLLYLGACWALATEYDTSLRTLDKALWTLDISD